MSEVSQTHSLRVSKPIALSMGATDSREQARSQFGVALGSRPQMPWVPLRSVSSDPHKLVFALQRQGFTVGLVDISYSKLLRLFSMARWVVICLIREILPLRNSSTFRPQNDKRPLNPKVEANPVGGLRDLEREAPWLFLLHGSRVRIPKLRGEDLGA